ncbi:response regulator [Pseudomonas sp. MWU12-2534b]|nr:response regulator [Pseudomonas sp. MWU12-2534b]
MPLISRPPQFWRLIRVCLLFSFMVLVSLFFSLPAHCAEPQEPGNPSLARLLDMRSALPHKVLRVATIVPPERPLESAGNQVLKVISDEYLKLIGKQLGLRFEYVELASPQEAIRALLEHRIDLLPRAAALEAQSPGLSLSRPYLNNQPIIVGRINDKSLPPDLEDKRVLVLDNYLDLKTVRKTYPRADVSGVHTTALALEQLAGKQADAFISDRFRTTLYMQARPDLRLHSKFYPQLPDAGFAFAVRREDATLRALIDYVLNAIPEEHKRRIQNQSSQEPFPFAPTESFSLTPGELNWLTAHRQINLLAEEAPPYIYRNAEGQWAGLSIDILRTLANSFRLQLNILPSRSRADDLEQLATGSADLTTRDLGLPDNARGIGLSQSYGTRNWAFVVRHGDSSPSSLDAMLGRHLALPRNHPLLEHLKQRYPDIHLVLTEDHRQALNLVLQRQVDATLDTPVGTEALSGSGLQFGLAFDALPTPHRFAAAPGSRELLSVLDKLLDSMARNPQSDIQLIAEQQSSTALWSWVVEQAWHVGVVILIIFVLSLIWNWRLKIQVRETICVQTRLQDKLAFQFSLLNGLPTPLYVCDLDGRLSTCNRAYEEFFATSQEQVEGRLPTEQPNMPREFAEVLQEEHQLLLANHRPRFLDTSLWIKEQQYCLYQWLVPFYNARGVLQGLLGGWLDISERKNLELKLREAKQIAQKASAAKSEFLASMSHELRTPLNALVGLLELETSASQTPSHNLRVAQQSATSMIDLIGNILDLDKIESGLMQLAPHPTALEPLLANGLGLFAVQAREKRLQLNFDYQASRNRLYWVDSLRLQQILHNLLSNALKFTDRGHIQVTLRETHVRDDSSLLTLSVRDTGIGIPLANQAGIFEPYRQATARTAHLYGGSGLGLSICHQLVQLMGGRIWLESEPGQGCCIHVELPVSWQTANVEVAEQPEVPPITGKALRVLVVDDVSTNGLVLTLQLERIGHVAEHVSSGEEALQLLRHRHYDALISDCNMPGMDGYSLARAVREAEQQSGAKPRLIVGYTASALSNEATQCSNAGMNDLMIKPVTLARLQEVLGSHTGAGEERVRAFDIDHLKDLGENSPTLHRRILNELTKNLQQEIAELRTCVLANTPHLINDLTHRLSGVACLINAQDMARTCEALRKVDTGHAPSVRNCQQALLNAMEQVYAEARQQLASLREASDADSGPQPQTPQAQGSPP